MDLSKLYTTIQGLRLGSLGIDVVQERKKQVELIKLNPSDSIIEVQCTSIGLLRDVCSKLEQTVNHLFPGLSFHTQLCFPYGEKGMFTWDIHQHVVGHSFGALLQISPKGLKMSSKILWALPHPFS